MREEGKKEGSVRALWTKKNIIMALRIVLPVLCAATLIFIFSNSLRTGAQSSAQSSQVVDVVQDVAQAVAPESQIATATGEDYDKLHATIRNMAHVAEFVLLGASAAGCCLVYTQRKRYWWIGIGGLVLVPIIDETLQSFTANRGMEFHDMLLDFGGGMIGFAIVLGAFYGILWCINKRKEVKTADKKA